MHVKSFFRNAGLPRIFLAGLISLAFSHIALAQQSTTPAPLVLSAEAIVLEERYPAPGDAPNAEQDYDITPASAARQWVKTRLQPDGAPGVIKVILLDGRITREPLKTRGGIRGFFTDDQKYRYEGRLHLRVEHQPAAPGAMPAFAEAKESMFFTLPEDATLAQREVQVTAMVQNLMQRVELQLENNMLRHMPGVIR